MPYRRSMASSILVLMLLPAIVFCLDSAALDANMDANAIIQIIEPDFEDECKSRAEFEWEQLTSGTKNLDEKLELDQQKGHFEKSQREEVMILRTDDPVLNRKIELMYKPGDTLLGLEQWNKLVTYADTAEYNLEAAQDIDCNPNKLNSCSFSDYINFLATSRNEKQLALAKASIESKMPDVSKYASEILPLLNNASKLNGYNNVQDYWEMLVEYEGAYRQAKQIWSDIEPLYEKLQMYVSRKLGKKYVLMPDDGIPSFLLGSMYGEDWLNLADLVMPNQEIYHMIIKNLEQKNMGGRNAFKAASNTLHQIGLGQLNEKFWSESDFDQTCPIKLVNYCQANGIRVSSCKDVRLPLFLDAYEAALTVKQAQFKFHKKSNSFILREGNRYSALDEAISGVGSLIAMAAHEQNPDGVFSLRLPEDEKHQYDKAVTLQLLLALRDLPRLSYYFSADSWRLGLLNNPQVDKMEESWFETRKQISHVFPSGKEYLADPNILKNKPLIGKFMGIILKYQLYDFLTESDRDKEDSLSNLIQRAPKLRKMMEEALLKKWPVIINEVAAVGDPTSLPLLNYFEPLLEFLNEQLENENPVENSVEEQKFQYEGGNSAESPEDLLKKTDEMMPEEISESVMRQSDQKLNQHIRYESTTSHSKPPKDTSESNPQLSESLKNSDPPKADGEIDAATLQYAAIGIGVLLLLIVILTIVIIARKRYKHKKDLERERRHGAA